MDCSFLFERSFSLSVKRPILNADVSFSTLCKIDHDLYQHSPSFSLDLGYCSMLRYSYRYLNGDELFSSLSCKPLFNYHTYFPSLPPFSKSPLRKSLLTIILQHHSIPKTNLTNSTFSPDACNARCILERINKTLGSRGETLGRATDEQIHADEFQTPGA